MIRMAPSQGAEPAIPTYHHSIAFGLHLRSRIPLPELMPGTGPEYDIDITYGEVPETLTDPKAEGLRYQASPGLLLIKVDGVARYLAIDGREIRIDRHPDADEDDVRLFLLGSAVGAILHQRQDLVLHGSAVMVDGAAAAFLGHSGAGKSTTAMALRARGHAIVTDDLCVVRAGPGGAPLLYPGFPQAKLWLDSLQKLELSPENLKRIRRKLEKRALPLGDEFVREPVSLKKLYVLRPTSKEELSISEVKGTAKFTVLRNQTYRFQFLEALGAKNGHFQLAMALAQRCTISIVNRSRDTFQLSEMIDRIEADIRA